MTSAECVSCNGGTGKLQNAELITPGYIVGHSIITEGMGGVFI